MRKDFILLVAATLAAAGMWIYVQRVLIPYQIEDAFLHDRPRGILSDLYPRWVGAEELLRHGRNPYSAEVTAEIQRGYYGRVLQAGRPGDPKDEQRFAYPVYVVFLLAPWLPLTFDRARWIISLVMIALTMGSVPLWIRVIGWKPKWPTTLALVLLTTSSFAAVQGIKLQQLSLLVAALLALCAYFVVTGRLAAAGACLALASIKPQLMAPMTLWLFTWTVGDWRRRQTVVWSAMASMAVLFAAGELVLPGWIWDFASAVAAYERYTGGGSLLDLLAGRLAGTIISVLIAILVVAVVWRSRKVQADSDAFAGVTACVLAATALWIPMMAPYNHLILLPAVLLSIRHWPTLWKRGRLTRLVCFSAATVVIWPWPVAFLLVLASFAAPHGVLKFWAAPLWTSLSIPLTIFPLSFATLRSRERLEA